MPHRRSSRSAGQLRVPGGMALGEASYSAPLARRSAANSRIVSSIQKRSPRRSAKQALVDERLERVDGPRRRPPRPPSSVQPPAKTASRAKSRCSSVVEQVVRPGDRRTQRLLAAARRRGRRLRRSSRCPSRSSELPRREHTRSRGGQLERQRQVVEPAAELLDRRSLGRNARARVQKSSTASGSPSGGTAYSTSPRTRSSSRLVTSRRRFGHASTQRARARVPRRPPARGCRAAGAARARRCAAQARPSPRASARSPRSTRAGSRSVASPTQKTPLR